MDLLLGNQRPEALQQFWEHVVTLDPWKHVAREFSRSDYSRLIPITLHCDGAEMYRDQEYMSWSWTAYFQGPTKGDHLLHKFPILVVSEMEMVDNAAARKACHVTLRRFFFNVCQST